MRTLILVLSFFTSFYFYADSPTLPNHSLSNSHAADRSYCINSDSDLENKNNSIAEESAISTTIVSGFPKNKQLFARDILTNLAEVKVEGSTTIANLQHVELRVFRENVLVQTVQDQLVFTNGSASFSVMYDLPSERANYKFELYTFDGNLFNLIESADEVVAGDVYILDGQSNAEAKMWNGSAAAYTDQFIRVFGKAVPNPIQTVQDTWFIGQGDGDRTTDGNTGQWGLVMANLISINTNVPIAIFNGAHGGTTINFHKRNDSDPSDLNTNYGRLFQRLLSTGLANKVRGILWYQGESDGINAMSQADYESHYDALYQDWKEDFVNTEQFYTIQVRTGCGNNVNLMINIQEAQRRQSHLKADMKLMTTKGIPTDGCHYMFNNAYEELGKRMANLILNDFYNGSNPDADAPDVIAANFLQNDPTKIILTLSGTDALFIDANSASEFEVPNNSVLSVTSVGHNSVVLQMASSVVNGSTITYLDKTPTTSIPYIKDSAGIGLISFKDLNVSGSLELSLMCPPEAGLLQGSSIVPVTVIATGGDGSYSYSIAPPNSGLSIDNNGLITSTPLNTLGWLDYSVTVTDSSGASATCSSRFFVDAGDMECDSVNIEISTNGPTIICPPDMDILCPEYPGDPAWVTSRLANLPSRTPPANAIQVANFATPNVQSNQAAGMQVAINAAGVGGFVDFGSHTWWLSPPASSLGAIKPLAGQTWYLQAGGSIRTIPGQQGVSRMIKVDVVGHTFYNEGELVGDLIERNTPPGSPNFGENIFGISYEGTGANAAKDCVLIGGKYHHFHGDGIFVGRNGLPDVERIYIADVHSYDNMRQGLSIVSGKDVFVIRGLFEHTGRPNVTLKGWRWKPTCGIDVESNFASGPTTTIIKDCIARFNYGAGFNTQAPYGPPSSQSTATVDARYWFCVAHNNGLHGAIPHSGFHIKEGGEAYLYHCDSNNNYPHGVEVLGAFGTRTNQGRVEIYGGSINDNEQMGVVSGTVDNIVCENVEVLGNPQGDVVAVNGQQTFEAENVVDQSCIDEFDCMDDGSSTDLSLTCPAEAGLLQGASIAPVSVTTSGGDGNYSYAIAPADSGLSIDNTGLITSIPLNTLGWLDYTVTVTDSSGAGATCSSRFFVDDGSSTDLSLTCPAEAGLLQGASIVPVSVTTSGGDGNYSYAITPADSGLSIDNTGLITSIPLNTLGWLDYTVTVTDGTAASISCSSRFFVDAGNGRSSHNFAQGRASQNFSLELQIDIPNTSTAVWSEGSTGSTITVNTPGDYTVTVTSVDGCQTVSNTVAIIEDPIACLDPCEDYYNLHGTLPSDTYKVRQFIKSRSTVNQGSVDFLANDFITLNSGFEVSNSATFLADMNGCN